MAYQINRERMQNDSAYRQVAQTYQKYRQKRDAVDAYLNNGFGDLTASYPGTGLCTRALKDHLSPYMNFAAMNIAWPLKQLMQKIEEGEITEEERQGILRKTEPAYREARRNLSRFINCPRIRTKTGSLPDISYLRGK